MDLERTVFARRSVQLARCKLDGYREKKKIPGTSSSVGTALFTKVRWTHKKKGYGL